MIIDLVFGVYWWALHTRTFLYLLSWYTGIWSNSALILLHSLRCWLGWLVMVILKEIIALSYSCIHAYCVLFVLHLFMLEDKHWFKFGGVISGFYIYLERSIRTWIGALYSSMWCLLICFLLFCAELPVKVNKQFSITFGWFLCVNFKNRDFASTDASRFCGFIYYRPSRDLTRPLGLPRGLKGLLHMPNATVITYGSGTS